MMKKKLLLITLLMSSGLYNSLNARQYVNELSNENIEEMVHALSSENLKPAYFVASITNPLARDLNLNNLNQLEVNSILNNELNEINDFLFQRSSLQDITPEQLEKIKDSLKKFIEIETTS